MQYYSLVDSKQTTDLSVSRAMSKLYSECVCSSLIRKRSMCRLTFLDVSMLNDGRCMLFYIQLLSLASLQQLLSAKAMNSEQHLPMQ